MKQKLIVVGVAIPVPPSPTSEQLTALARIQAVGRRIEGMLDTPLDPTHLGDFADLAESIESIYRRARACDRGDQHGTAVHS